MEDIISWLANLVGYAWATQDAALRLASLVLVGWVAQDAARRNRPWFRWALLVAFLNVFGLPFWLYARRKSPPSSERLPRRRHALLWLSGVPVYAVSFLLSLAVAALTVTFVVQVATNLGQAMSPTLLDEQQVFVNKMVYRLGEPQRGDIVMHLYPRDPTKSFVKRIIGVGGDRVHIVDGRVSVNGVPLDEDYVVDEARSHEDHGPEAVRESHYFVMGDNRNNSSDSRHWGQVPRDHISGRVVIGGASNLLGAP